MGVLALVVLIFGLVQGTMIIQRIEHTDNHDYFTVNVSIVNASGRSVIDLDAIMYKTWGMGLTFRFSLFAMERQKPRLIMPFPKYSYCDMMRTSSSVPFVIQIMEQFTKFGNLSLTCPIQKSYRYLRNYYIDDERIPLMKTLPPNSNYMMQLIFDDESGKAATNIFRAKIFIRYLKGKP